MKAFSFSRISLLLGVIVGLMVVWAAAVPGTMTTDSLIGGWVPTAAGDCCEGDHNEPCDDYASCDEDDTPIVTCENLDPDPVIGNCTAGDNQPCSFGELDCTTTWDGECE